MLDHTAAVASESSAPTPAFETGQVYTFEPHRAEWLNEKFQGIARRARRSGVVCAPRLAPASEPYPVYHAAYGSDWECCRDECGNCIVVDAKAGQRCEGGVCWRHWYEVVVQDYRAEGEMPVLPGGWYLVAAIDRVPAMGTIVREAPGRTCPPEFRGESAANRCDHCGTHRSRRVVYVLADADGKHLQVGSTCVAEFVRDPSVEAAISAILSAQEAWAGVPTEDEDGNPLAGRGNAPKPLHTYLSMVAAYMRINHNMYVTKKSAGEGAASTGCAATYALEANTEKEKRAWPDHREPQDLARAKAAIVWASDLPANGPAFEQNMRTLARSGFYLPKYAGTAAYIVAAYARATNTTGAHPARPKTPRLQAEVGAKVQRELEVVRVVSFESAYGTTYITVMRTLPRGAVSGGVCEEVTEDSDVGALVAWKSKETPFVRSAFWMDQVAEAAERGKPTDVDAALLAKGGGQRTPVKAGDRIVATFKVKEHVEYKGAPQTNVTNLSVACDGWGYAADAGTPGARLSAERITAGANAPLAPVKLARKPRAKKVAPVAVIDGGTLVA